jgi:hypothetical protein
MERRIVAIETLLARMYVIRLDTLLGAVMSVAGVEPFAVAMAVSQQAGGVVHMEVRVVQTYLLVILQREIPPRVTP